MDKYSVLRQYFGHMSFRSGQEQMVDSILAGQDVLGIMPTGGGKSLCYQVPALLLPGLTLVISPLISLMKDQVSALTSAGVPAAFLNSSQSEEEAREVWQGIQRRTYRMVYVAPERLENQRFFEMIIDREISLIAVDEAHCVSQWGQDFRPSYLKIAEFVTNLPLRPVLAAFTATATALVQQDIVERLALCQPVRVVTGFDRPNLYFEVQKPRQKLATLSALIGARSGRSGIVYCATRAAVEQVCASLQGQGILATRYHAGLSEEERRQNQDDFQFDRCTVMVATNAFGMGIDKSNVSFVIHYNMPKNLESYYQEAGRAGRDGEPAECILLYANGDITTAKFLIDNSIEGSELSPQEQRALRQRELKRLDAMVEYCKTTQCLRGRILEYFGQAHPENCGNCGNCHSVFTEVDITVQAQMILSCVKRVKDQLGYSVGAGLIIKVLRGSRGERIHALRLDSLPTYGLMKAESTEQLRAYLDCLAKNGYVFTDPEYATLRLSQKAGRVLFQGETVSMPVKLSAPETPAARSVPSAPIEEGGLLAVLKAERNRLAREEGVPAYIIFSNATLADMAAKCPRTPEAFLEVSGVGKVKAARYGQAFLDTITSYLSGK